MIELKSEKLYDPKNMPAIEKNFFVQVWQQQQQKCDNFRSLLNQQFSKRFKFFLSTFKIVEHKIYREIQKKKINCVFENCNVSAKLGICLKIQGNGEIESFVPYYVIKLFNVSLERFSIFH